MNNPVVLGDCTLYLGDCMEVMPTLEAGSVDTVITDPPFSEKVRNGARTRNDNIFGGEPSINFSITAVDLREFFVKIGRLCNGWVIATIDWRYGSDFENNPPNGLDFIRAGIWIKTNSAPQFTGDRPAHAWEFVAIMHSNKTPLKWNGKGGRGVWINSVDSISGHPSPKPLLLIKKWVIDFSNSNDAILDPMMGSGTTGIACVQTGRKFIGIEIEPKYFDIAVKRIKEAQMQMRMDI